MIGDRISGQLKFLRAITDETPGAPPLALALTRLAIWRARCALGLGTHVPAWGNATSIYCPPEWRGNAKVSYVMRGAIESDLSVAVALVEPGSHVVDVGAHYGAFTLPLARAVGPDGRVMAFEPNPAARSVLTRGLRESGLTNAIVQHYAVSDQTGCSHFSIADDPSRSALSTADESQPVIAVQTQPLDALLKDRTKPIRLLKVDVEGHESNVFLGARNVLQEDKPVVVFEDLPGLRNELAAVHEPVDILRELGYVVREFSRGVWRDVPGYSHESKNLWAFPEPVSAPAGASPEEMIHSRRCDGNRS